ncbi:ABC transporter substrate-binding protein [Cryptosporangium sp. NPDC048952]|uniref:ABC transporter substrate-binding protein n=1 Tax=Cryptosporangium sp. NPDC048952 TaxID=3363961 RepID=UPI0037106625
MTYTNSRRLLAVALTITAGLAVTSLTACSSSDDAASDGSVRLVINPAAPPALPLIAQKIGAFKDNNLTVTISTQPTTAITTFAPALGKRYDIAWGTPADVIAAAAKGQKIKAIAGAYQDTQESQQGQLFASKSSGIASLKDLKGKRVATPSLSGTLYLALRTSIAAQGIDPNDVTLVEVPFTNMLDQLNANRVDAIALIQPFIGRATAAGHTALGDPFLSVASPALAGMWIANTEWAAKNKKTIDSFTAALDSAKTWADGHQDEARKDIAEALDLPPQVMAGVPLPAWDTTITPQLLEPWIKAVNAAGQVNGKLPAASDLVAVS